MRSFQLQVRTFDRREIEAMVKRIAAVGEHFSIAHWREESGFPADLQRFLLYPTVRQMPIKPRYFGHLGCVAKTNRYSR
jgi:hypothetical protein